MRKIKKQVKKIIVLLLILLIVLVPLFEFKRFVDSPRASENKSIVVRITKGMNSSQIIDKLYNLGLIENKLFAKIYMKTNGIGNNLKAGIYRFNMNMTPRTIFTMLKNREIDLSYVNFTVPEGYSVKQIALKLYNLGVIKSTEDFYRAVRNDEFTYEFLKNLPSDRTYRLEGYLYPDTYEFEKGMSIHLIIDKMLKRFDEVYVTYRAEVEKSKLPLDKIINMASMVEGEARVDDERPLIAAVLFNRLNMNMRLQIDATVQYALGEHKSVLYYSDLKIDSPYNTYKYNGVPRGPICSPGIKSIKAVLSPSDVDYIYYIAKGNGGHFFTKSYREFLNYKNSLKK